MVNSGGRGCAVKTEDYTNPRVSRWVGGHT